jgi:hypothetical protein
MDEPGFQLTVKLGHDGRYLTTTERANQGDRRRGRSDEHGRKQTFRQDGGRL